MGYLLKEALKTLCGVNQWCYAIFWKIGEQNPKLLVWEECYYEPISNFGIRHASGFENSELVFGELENLQAPAESRFSHIIAHAGGKVQRLVRKMMQNHVNVLGEGLVGRAAYTGNHQWFLSGECNVEVPPEVLNEVCQQFAAGMQTVAVIPVLPHGVVQLGSSLSIMENVDFVNDVKALVAQLGCVPGVLLSNDYATEDPNPKTVVPVPGGNSISMVSSGRYDVTNSFPYVSNKFNRQINSTCVLTHNDQRSSYSDKQFTDTQLSSLTSQSSLSHNISKTTFPSCEPKNLSSTTKIQSTDLQETGVNKSRFLHGLSHGDDSHILSGSSQHSVVLSVASNSGMLKQQISSDSIVGNHNGKSLNMPDGLMMSHQITNGGLPSSSCQASISTTLLGMSKVCDGQYNYLSSLSNSCPLSGIPANDNVSCSHVVESEVQDVCSFKKIPKPEIVDHLTTSRRLLLGTSNGIQHSTDEECTQIESAESRTTGNYLSQPIGISMGQSSKHLNLSGHAVGSAHIDQNRDYDTQNLQGENVRWDDGSLYLPSGDDLFDILGSDFKRNLLNGGCGSSLDDRLAEENACNQEMMYSTSMKLQDTNLYSVNECSSGSGIFSVTDSDHLLEAVVSRTCFRNKRNLEDSVSCGTTLTNLSSASVCNVSPSHRLVSPPDHLQSESPVLPCSLLKAALVGSHAFKSESCKENVRSQSQSSSVYGSQISSWVEHGHDVKQNSSVSTGYSKKHDQIGKSNRKRSKPGENPRPRPKDRQMIQDRLKELRDIVPNGAKCSIDALLERTIKHMLFLQSVAKHADKLKQSEETKVVGKGGGILSKDNFEGGATWAYEVSAHSMVCPIRVEDLNSPRQMLVEMLCEEQGLFLEIADIIRGLGLTILKGFMETCNDKIWARFAVEANRDVTRMEIFMSLVHLFDQTTKGNAASRHSFGNDDAVQFHQATSVPATGALCGLH